MVTALKMSKEIPSNYVQLNQDYWRSAERNGISKPLELSRTAKILHKRMVDTFNLQSPHEPILTWSLVFDKPKTPSSRFVYEERFPDEIKEEDRADFLRGMGRITEYATNIATIDFIKKNVNIPFVNTLADIYTKFGDLATYRLLINGTYRDMDGISYIAERNGKNYKEALYKGLFEHDCYFYLFS